MGSRRPKEKTTTGKGERERGLSLSPTALLREAHAYARKRGLSATDDAQLVRALGYPVALVEGERAAFKITYPEDLPLAEALARVWSA